MNSAALAQAGIREGQPDPLGGRFERAPDGRLSGVIREYAVFDAERILADQTSEADALSELRETFSDAIRWGITTVQDMSNDMPPERCIALLEKLPSPIRVRVMRMPGTTPAGRDIEEGRRCRTARILSLQLVVPSGYSTELRLKELLHRATTLQPWATSFCTNS
jgi:hypothetical protein